MGKPYSYLIEWKPQTGWIAGSTPAPSISHIKGDNRIMSKEKKYRSNAVPVRFDNKELHDFVKMDAKNNNRSVGQEMRFLMAIGKKEVERRNALIENATNGDSQIDMSRIGE